MSEIMTTNVPVKIKEALLYSIELEMPDFEPCARLQAHLSL
jgi:hypothetical protein